MLDKIAKEFADLKFQNVDHVLGVLLTGSASLGYEDDASDVDLLVISSGNQCGDLKGIRSFQRYCGVEVWWEWTTLEEVEGELKDWRNDVDLWVYSRSKILHDKGNRIETLLAKYRQYSEEIWLQKLFLYWYFATGHAPYDSGKAIQRRDLLTAQLYLNQAMEYYTALIFILNRSFVPYRKWRLQELRKLVHKPLEFEERLRKVLTTFEWAVEEFQTKQDVIREFVSYFERELEKAGLPKDKIKNPQKFKVAYAPSV